LYFLVGFALWGGLVALNAESLMLAAMYNPMIFTRFPIRWAIGITVSLTVSFLLLYLLLYPSENWFIIVVIIFVLLFIAALIGYFISALIGQSMERQRLLDELTQTRASLLKAEREAVVLAERQRLARDIHDTLAQGFTGVVLNLEAASRALKKDNVDPALEHIEHARSLAQAGLAEARLSVRALRPEALQQADLGNALQALLRKAEASGTLRTRFVSAGDKIPLPGEVESELLRIAQEGVTNILKHAGAQQVELSLAFGADSISLLIADDGAGFDPRAHHDGFGLLGMRERAERIGGRLLVTSMPTQGTRVETVIPRSAFSAAKNPF